MRSVAARRLSITTLKQIVWSDPEQLSYDMASSTFAVPIGAQKGRQTCRKVADQANVLGKSDQGRL